MPLAQSPNRIDRNVERRSQARHTLVLRVGVLEQDGRAIFCLVKNISSSGVQVKPFGRLAEGAAVTLRVGDEDAIPGTVVWLGDLLAGIEFDRRLGSEALLRVEQKMAASRRRCGPRVDTDLDALLRTGGRTYRATLCDLSMQGARVRTDRPVTFGESTIIEVQGLPGLRSFVRWSDGMEFGVSFETAIPMQIIAGLLEEQKRPPLN